MSTRNEIKSSKDSSKLHIDFLKFNYGKKYEQWFMESDDRKLFCNIYEQLLDMYTDMKFVKSPATKVAINRYAREEEKTMDNIIARFK